MSISDLINIKSKVMRGRQAAPAPGGRRRDGKGKPLTESPVFKVRLVELIIKSTNLYFTIKLIPAIITPADGGAGFAAPAAGTRSAGEKETLKFMI